MMTTFTRIIIVLSILRQALGLQQTPPNQVLVGLALFLSLFVMRPAIDQINASAWKPYGAGQIGIEEAVGRSGGVLHGFMERQVRQTDLKLFADMAKAPPFAKPADIPFTILLPAFVTSELKTAFQIGFLIFLPFLIIDLVVASTLMALGMVMLSPNKARQIATTISLGTNASVCSLIEVAAWIIPSTSPATSAGIRIGAHTSASTHSACWATPMK